MRKLTRRRISLFSGYDFTVAPEQGLAGFCDYIISRSPEQLFIAAPALIVIEAKNENIKGGLLGVFLHIVGADDVAQAEQKIAA